VTGKKNKQSSDRVFVLRDEKPVEVEVVLGLKNRVSAEVISGLSEEQEVITGPIDSGKNRPRVMLR
jgi:hypothetical protein